MAIQAKFRNDGAVIDYTPGADIEAGQVVPLTGRCGITLQKIDSGVQGALQIEGIFEMTKASGAITAFASVYWDDTANKVTTVSSGNTPLGVAVPKTAAGAGYATADTTILVKIGPIS